MPPMLRVAKPSRCSCGAFTLIELLTVLAIIGILTTIVVGSANHARQAAKIGRAKAELAAVASGLEAYYRRYGDYPQTNSSAVLLQSLLGRQGPDGSPISDRAVIDVARLAVSDVGDPSSRTDLVLIDPWEAAYEYRYCPATARASTAYLLFSRGPDGLSTLPSNRSAVATDHASDSDDLYANR